MSSTLPLPAAARRARLRAATAAVTFLTLAGCSRGSASTAALPVAQPDAVTVAVRVAKPLPRLDGEVARATGEVRSKLQATLCPKAGGPITRLFVDVGSRVKQGDPIVQLDTSTLVIQIDQARAARRVASAARDNARAELARTKTLFEAGSAPPAVMDKVQAAYEQSDAAVAQADAQVRYLEQLLRDNTLRAPFDGVITARLKNVGDYVATMPPTPVAALTSLDALEVRLAVPEGLVDRLRPGQVLAGKAVPSGAAFAARVTSVGTTVDAGTRAVEVIAAVTTRPGAALRPGGLAEVDLGSSAAGEGPLVPASSLERQGEQQFVWVVAQGGAVAKRPVSVEPVTPQWVRVRGIGAADDVVVEGATGLKDGQRVSVTQ